MPKLTDADAAAIRALYAQGELSYRKIARKYDVNVTLIGRIVRGEEWRTSSRS